MEHSVALVGLLWLPPVVIALLVFADLLARANVTPARRFLDRLERTPRHVKLAVLLMGCSVAIHASLVDTHIGQDALLAAMFAIYSVTLAALSVAAFVVDGWRPVAVLVLAGGIAAYGFYVLTGRESVDAVGLASKLIEATALTLLLIRMPVVFVSPRGSETVTAPASPNHRR